MTASRIFLILATVLIYAITVVATMSYGPNWPAVALSDLAALNWRSQFDADFILYLIIFATWVSWREGFTARTHALGVLSIVMGGMFGFPYLLYATYVAEGDPKRVLLGKQY